MGQRRPVPPCPVSGASFSELVRGLHLCRRHLQHRGAHRAAAAYLRKETVPVAGMHRVAGHRRPRRPGCHVRRGTAKERTGAPGRHRQAHRERSTRAGPRPRCRVHQREPAAKRCRALDRCRMVSASTQYRCGAATWSGPHYCGCGSARHGVPGQPLCWFRALSQLPDGRDGR